MENKYGFHSTINPPPGENIPHASHGEEKFHTVGGGLQRREAGCGPNAQASHFHVDSAMDQQDSRPKHHPSSCFP